MIFPRPSFERYSCAYMLEKCNFWLWLCRSYWESRARSACVSMRYLCIKVSSYTPTIYRLKCCSHRTRISFGNSCIFDIFRSNFTASRLFPPSLALFPLPPSLLSPSVSLVASCNCFAMDREALRASAVVLFARCRGFTRTTRYETRYRDTHAPPNTIGFTWMFIGDGVVCDATDRHS